MDDPVEEVDNPDAWREVRVRRVNDDPEHRADGIRALRGIWAESGGGTRELLEERRRERDAEERKAPG